MKAETRRILKVGDRVKSKSSSGLYRVVDGINWRKGLVYWENPDQGPQIICFETVERAFVHDDGALLTFKPQLDEGFVYDTCEQHGAFKVGPKQGGLFSGTCPDCNDAEDVVSLDRAEALPPLPLVPRPCSLGFIPPPSLARKVFNRDGRVKLFAETKAEVRWIDSANMGVGRSHHPRFLRALDIAWERNENGWRTDAEAKAKEIEALLK